MMLSKDDSGPSRSRLYHNRLSDGVVWDSIEVRAEWNGIYTKRLGMANIRQYPNGDLTFSIVEQPE